MAMEYDKASDVNFMRQYIAEYRRRAVSIIEGPFACGKFTVNFSADYQELNGGTSRFEMVCDAATACSSGQDTIPATGWENRSKPSRS
jgi:hypothetical protein